MGQIVEVHATSSTPKAMPDARDVLYVQVQRRMVINGDWDRLSQALASKLNESGWTDSLHDSSKETARAGHDVSVTRLIEDLGPQATSSVPRKVKDETMHMIRQYLDTQLDK